MESYWRDADRLPFLIEMDSRTAGFALVNAHSHRGEPIDHAMAEFFVARQFRRAGVGHQAARAIFGAPPRPLGTRHSRAERRRPGVLAESCACDAGCA